jgi:hypothetical protein
MTEPAKPRVVGFNHVALEVGDIEEALAFYGREPKSAPPLVVRRRLAAVARPVPTRGKRTCVVPPTRSISGRSFRSRRA